MDRDQQRDYQTRLRKLRVYEGVTCSLELAFNHDSSLYVYELQPDWYEEFLVAEDEIAKRHGRERYRRRRLAWRVFLQELVRRARWLLPAPDPIAVAAVSAALQVGPPAAKVLVHRGFSDPEAARRFLHPAFEELHDPLAMRDMPAAIERIARAIREREPILIYGDYDVDGTTSVVLLTKAIELAGGIAAYHVPHRLKDGYGMRPEVVEAAAVQGVKLIVSVDTGIRAAEVVHRANELGIDVIVTDHHLPEADLPPALAVLNPNRPDCAYPEKNLCGAGVAFKLIQALLASHRLAGGQGPPRCRILPQTGGHRHRGRRGAADRRESHHRLAWLARSRSGAQSRLARPARCRGVHRRYGAQRAPGGASSSRRASTRPDAWTPRAR